MCAKFYDHVWGYQSIFVDIIHKKRFTRWNPNKNGKPGESVSYCPEYMSPQGVCKTLQDIVKVSTLESVVPFWFNRQLPFVWIRNFQLQSLLFKVFYCVLNQSFFPENQVSFALLLNQRNLEWNKTKFHHFWPPI